MQTDPFLQPENLLTAGNGENEIIKVTDFVRLLSRHTHAPRERERERLTTVRASASPTKSSPSRPCAARLVRFLRPLFEDLPFSIRHFSLCMQRKG
jgi:hypothetical protein